jgi:hypothetical protein
MVSNEQVKDREKVGRENVDGGRGQRRRFLVNRVLIVLAVAAVLMGLLSDQWRIVLRNAILL